MKPVAVLKRHMDEAVQDVRVAGRRMRREPALAAAIVLTLGLGLGVGTAIFSAFDAAMIQPPPFAEPDRLVYLWEHNATTSERSPTSYPTFSDWRSRASAFVAIEGYDPTNVAVDAGDRAQMLRGGRVSAGFFRLLGVALASGRDFAVDGDTGVGAPGVIVSDRLANRFSPGDSPLGRTMAVAGEPRVIIGVLPPTFHFAPLQDADVWLPLSVADDQLVDRADRWVSVVARLDDGMSLESAERQLSSVMSELAALHPSELAGRGVAVEPLRDALLGNVRPIMISLAGAVILLLATVCANLALLMTTRHLSRSRELSMRSALGATRGRVVRQLFTETMAFAVLGFLTALAVSEFAADALLTTIPAEIRIGMPYLARVAPDGGIIAITGAVAVLLTVLFGLGPALLATRDGRRRGISPTMTAARADRRVRRGLVVVQVALTVVLLSAAGLLLTSFRSLVGQDIGFAEPGELVTASVPLAGPRYQSDLAQRQFFAELLSSVEAVAGIERAAAINEVPLGGGGMTTLETVDRPTPAAAQPRTALRVLRGEYFSTMGIPLLEGRALNGDDRADTRPVAVVSAALAQRLAADGVAVGRRLRLAATGDTEWEVVGVVGNVQIANVDVISPSAVYVPHAQLAENRMIVVARTALAVDRVAEAMRSIVRTMDSAIPVYAVGTMSQRLNGSRAVFSRRFPMILCLAFALCALLLALVALYSVTAHEVLTRRREIGIRSALGATPTNVATVVLHDGLLLTAAGVCIGTVAARFASSALDALLFGTGVGALLVHAGVILIIVLSGGVATLVPAMRAIRLQPAVVMREH